MELGRRDYLALWADTPTEEKRNLRCLGEVLATNPSLPVVTWAGTGADLPRLRNAVRRLKLRQAIHALESRHLDLYQHVVNAVRFPTPSLALAEIATYFGIPKVSRIRDGLEAQFKYMEYRRALDNDTALSRKTDLLEYNRDDLEALVGVASRIAALQSP
ncbi:MAG: ribonuclease H-like domain-containing protein [Planctomycetes bacterium]|nr:ribonuclease H-like domain-containing protein [Planctomycetota bacterium]